MYDVVIIGARCAGSALALMLARDGLKVIAIDGTTFPSDTMSGHFNSRPACPASDDAACLKPGGALRFTRRRR